jgi:hypothetical protein
MVGATVAVKVLPDEPCCKKKVAAALASTAEGLILIVTGNCIIAAKLVELVAAPIEKIE